MSPVISHCNFTLTKCLFLSAPVNSRCMMFESLDRIPKRQTIIHAIFILCVTICSHNTPPSWIWVSSHNLTMCASFCHYAVVIIHTCHHPKHFWMWQSTHWSLSESHPWVTGYKQVGIWGISLSDSVKLSIIWRTCVQDYTLSFVWGMPCMRFCAHV